MYRLIAERTNRPRFPQDIAGMFLIAYFEPMAKKGSAAKALAKPAAAAVPATGRPSALLDTRVVYCGDNLEQLAKLPDHCVDLVSGGYIDPPFDSNRNYEIFWGETKEKRSFEDGHAASRARWKHAWFQRGSHSRLTAAMALHKA
jgi:hypothetical protein